MAKSESAKVFAAVLALAAVTAAPARADGWVDDWLAMVTRVQSAQPKWMGPLVTTTPLLMQQFRYDAVWQHAGNGANTRLIGNAKGLELVLPTATQLQFNMPPYVERDALTVVQNGKVKTNPAVSGFADWPFLLLKQRLAAGTAK